MNMSHVSNVPDNRLCSLNTQDDWLHLPVVAIHQYYKGLCCSARSYQVFCFHFLLGSGHLILIFIKTVTFACTTLLVDATTGTLAASDVFALRHCHKFPILSVKVVSCYLASSRNLWYLRSILDLLKLFNLTILLISTQNNLPQLSNYIHTYIKITCLSRFFIEQRLFLVRPGSKLMTSQPRLPLDDVRAQSHKALMKTNEYGSSIKPNRSCSHSDYNTYVIPKTKLT